MGTVQSSASQEKPLENIPSVSRSVWVRPPRLVGVAVECLVDVAPERVLVVPAGKSPAELEVDVVQHQRLAEELEGSRPGPHRFREGVQASSLAAEL